MMREKPQEPAALPVRAASWAAGRPALAALLCVGGLVAIGLLDLVGQTHDWPVPIAGLLDEPAHLLTAGLLLAALLPLRAAAVLPWALAAAVLIDLDHVPLYLWGALTPDGAGRPGTHSLTTVLVLAVAGAVSRPRRVRIALLGLALGVGLHLVRDLGTGPGVPLWWPIASEAVRVPYPAYAGVMTAAALLAVCRVARYRALVAAGRRNDRPRR